MPPSLSDLLEEAAAQQRSGDWKAAAATLQRAYDGFAASGNVAGVVESVVRMGHCYRLAGERELAEDLLALALDLGEFHADPAVSGRALNGLAGLAQDRGEIALAEQLYRAAHRNGQLARDDVLVGETAQNLGTVANIRGNHAEARAHYRTGLVHLERAGSERGQIAVLNNLGMLSVDLGELADAEGYFARALAVCERVGDVVNAGVVHINRAELFLARGDLDAARESCDHGFEIFSRLGLASRRAEALKFYGIIYRESGKLHLAEIHLRQAVGRAEPTDPLLEAEVQRELARVLREQGRNREALEALNRSHSLFTGLQARSDLADIDARVRGLEEDFLSLVRLWGESIEAKDRYTVGHCARVAEYACRLAAESGVTEREMVWFRMGAFLHDVGKTEVPEEILNKPGRLTAEERAVMERHPVIGDRMLAPVEFPWDVRSMVRSHHERWDGRGYPDGLAGEAIPLAARILRVADVFDALTTARSYRGRLSPEAALAEMETDVGSFDPAVFETFRALFPALAPTAARAVSGLE